MTHLRSGQLIAHLRGTLAEATDLADQVAMAANWADYATGRELVAVDRDATWRVVSLKHELGQDWIEFPDARMNDPANHVAWAELEAAALEVEANEPSGGC